MKTRKIGGKEYGYNLSVNVSQAFSHEAKRLQEENIPLDDPKYSTLIIATFHEAIKEGFYQKSFLHRLFREWLTPSVKTMYHALDFNDILEMVAEINGVSKEDLLKNVGKKKAKKK